MEITHIYYIIDGLEDNKILLYYKCLNVKNWKKNYVYHQNVFG